jgi:hypothetical protein
MIALSPNIFAKPDGGSARSARPRLTNAIMADRNATAEDKDSALKPLRERMAAFNCEIAKWWSGS